ncbi:S46 family peptidase [Pleionea sp. CnH1-48]|uniref:S46 family peptidase n=1 Tax=Pleionea sp. CnH1-48 TaxID=2954494 RepID=UPI00209804BB|nr:S46 family peptidase [Pleionea sp. CnH1-48]MCO7226840.1 S46 family peptidase [Pleionea sp. CnH1-48]
MKKLLTLLAAGMTSLVVADEGMWQPHQLPIIAGKLKEAGLELDPKDLQDLTGFPMGAIVSLGGCTASFVSDKGLVVTNHHCAYGSIQYNSKEGNNLLEKGFLAKSFDKELPAAPGSRVYVTENITNVTDKMKSVVNDKMGGEERFKALDKMTKTLVAECESNKDYRCSVVNFHGGLEYYLFKQLTIRDVRLVHAPASSIGKYGGDIDNWQWPRHTGDYAFYRAYVGKDGKPADFNKDNVPFEPKHHLKVNAKGVADKDYIMVLGYPGRTNRYRTATEVQNEFTVNYPLTKALMGELIQVIKDNSAEGSDDRIKYESSLAGLANYEKNRGSMIESYHKGTTQQRKDAREKAMRGWVKKSKSNNKKYGKAISQLDKLIDKAQKDAKRDTILNFMGFTRMMSTANRLHRLAIEKQKADIDRERGYQERDMKRFEQGMRAMDRRYAPKVDKALLQHMLTRYAELPKEQRRKDLDKFFGIGKKLDAKKLSKRLDAMYAKSKLGDENTRLDWMNKSVEDFNKSDDPFIKLAIATYDARMKAEKESKQLSGDINAVRPKYMEAMIAFYNSKNKPVYADANSTLRVTYGNVKGYSPKDGLYAVPFTRLEGITQKDTGEKPFDSPKKQLELIEGKQYGNYYMKDIDSVPVNFLGTLDITGGNSGSPTLNGKAELVGLVFDGVYESIIGDWDYEPALNRSIHVDARYMLWVMENIDGADNLIKEMDVIR